MPTGEIAKKAEWLVRRPKFAVFPLHTIDSDTGYCSCGSQSCSSPGKHPIASLAPHGVKDATTDPSTVAQWWALYPDANIGVACGAASMVTVVDIDPDHGGNRSWQNLIDKHGEVDGVWVSRTGSGGYHYWFQYVEGLKNRVGVVPGIDVRTDGGYVVAPPSLHISGLAYEWDEGNRPSASFQQTGVMPDWLIKLAGGSSKERERAATVVGKISDGQRNNTLASLAGTMRRRGMEEDEIRAALDVVNRNRCDPPLNDKEVGSIAWSIGRLPPAAAEHGAMKYGGGA